MKSSKKFILILLIFLFIIFTVILSWFLLQYVKDPLDLIKRPVGQITSDSDSTIVADYLPKDRYYLSTTLQTAQTGTISMVISFPEDTTTRNWPVVIILGGLEIGTYTLGYIPEPGNNVIIIYQYPYHPDYWYQGTALREIPVIRESVMNVPAQILTLYEWTACQNWADRDRITISGYSFGALFMPAIYHLAEYHGHHIKYGVIAYGGADIYQLLVANMNQVVQPFRSIIAWFAASAIRGIEPALHAPFLRSHMLLINGKRDRLIPVKNWQKLHGLIPEPKTTIILDEGHMHQRKKELTRRLVTLSQEWLIKHKMINP